MWLSLLKESVNPSYFFIYEGMFPGIWTCIRAVAMLSSESVGFCDEALSIEAFAAPSDGLRKCCQQAKMHITAISAINDLRVIYVSYYVYVPFCIFEVGGVVYFIPFKSLY